MSDTTRAVLLGVFTLSSCIWVGGFSSRSAWAGLASDQAWDGVLVTTVVVAAALLASLAVGVAQARRMTRLRAAALADPSDSRFTHRIRSGAHTATVLRAAIGLLSLALIALGSLLAT